MTETLEALIRQLENNIPYQAMDEDEIRRRAQERYQSAYDGQREVAQRNYEANDAALARELQGLSQTYEERRAQTAAQTAATYAQTDRHALSRGMQRSSYNEASLANIRMAGDEALNALTKERAQQENALNTQRLQLGKDLQDTLGKLETQRKADELAYADELTEREYQREKDSQNTYRELAMQLYEYRRQQEKDEQEQARWQAEFNARYGAK